MARQNTSPRTSPRTSTASPASPPGSSTPRSRPSSADTSPSVRPPAHDLPASPVAGLARPPGHPGLLGGCCPRNSRATDADADSTDVGRTTTTHSNPLRRWCDSKCYCLDPSRPCVLRSRRTHVPHEQVIHRSIVGREVLVIAVATTPFPLPLHLRLPRVGSSCGSHCGRDDPHSM